jgi:hypothetical protein
MKLKLILGNALLCGLLALGVGSSAHAGTIIYTGYYDLPPPTGGNPNTLPDPWYGSTNTTFLGSSSQATAADPDEAAVLIQNTGPAAVTLSQGATVGGFTLWDTLIGAGGLSIGAGDYVILSGTTSSNMDGSDGIFSNSLVKLTINGTLYSFTDSTNALIGSPIGSANETIPWTQIGDISATSATPLPAALPLFATGLGALGLLGWRRKKKAAALAV